MALVLSSQNPLPPPLLRPWRHLWTTPYKKSAKNLVFTTSELFNQEMGSGVITVVTLGRANDFVTPMEESVIETVNSGKVWLMKSKNLTYFRVTFLLKYFFDPSFSVQTKMCLTQNEYFFTLNTGCSLNLKKVFSFSLWRLRARLSASIYLLLSWNEDNNDNY